MIFLGTPVSRKVFRNHPPGMTIDSMRVGGGRCLFLAVGVLFVVCVMLFCNWWALTTENTELLRQIDELSDQLKYSVDERDKCITRLGDIQEDVKRCKSENNLLHVKLEELKDDIKKRNNEFDESLTSCKNELKSLRKVEAKEKDELKSMKLEKENINTKLWTIRDENTKLKADVYKIKTELDKLKTVTYQQPRNVAQLLLPKATNTVEQETLAESNIHGDNKKFYNINNQDIAAEET